MSEEDKAKVASDALNVPVKLLKLCHEQSSAVVEFLPKCNPNITSDAKVAIHLLAGAGRAAYQTVLVNKPPADIDSDCKRILAELSKHEASVLEL
mmetsp:Transcript_39538/g.61651  ORF Transcript_39538/g.61651 Transcript_39538/m.61651 type:complete len:95 (-) Transcript_39538:206-490(-)